MKTFTKAVCRDCKHQWDLPKTYDEKTLHENMNAGDKLSVCPKCKSIAVSYPFSSAKDAPKVAKVYAEAAEVLEEPGK